MCGRFARFQPLGTWPTALGLEPAQALPDKASATADGPRYNIAPGTRTWLVIADDDGTLVVTERLWAFPTTRGNRINVRSETAHRVPEYRPHFDMHRCLVFASGFYEPEGPKSAKNRPWHFFQPHGGHPLFFGGILKAEGFSALTGPPAAPVAAIHDRSPVIIPAKHAPIWLDPEVSGQGALQQAAPERHGDGLESWRVGDDVKNASNEGPALIAPPRQQSLF